MSAFPLALFDLRHGEIVISPHKRYRTIIVVGNDHFFGEIRDRDRGNAVIVEQDDPNLLKLLARLVARGIGVGVFRTPPDLKRVGVRHDELCNSFGCYGLDNEGAPLTPIVVVEYALCWAIAQPAQGHPLRLSGTSPEDAMLQATSAFMAKSLAA